MEIRTEERLKRLTHAARARRGTGESSKKGLTFDTEKEEPPCRCNTKSMSEWWTA